MDKKKIIPKIKHTINAFLLGESGKIPKKSIIKLGAISLFGVAGLVPGVDAGNTCHASKANTEGDGFSSGECRTPQGHEFIGGDTIAEIGNLLTFPATVLTGSSSHTLYNEDTLAFHSSDGHSSDSDSGSGTHGSAHCSADVDWADTFRGTMHQNSVSLSTSDNQIITAQHKNSLDGCGPGSDTHVSYAAHKSDPTWDGCGHWNGC